MSRQIEQYEEYNSPEKINLHPDYDELKDELMAAK